MKGISRHATLLMTLRPRWSVSSSLTEYEMEHLTVERAQLVEFFQDSFDSVDRDTALLNASSLARVHVRPLNSDSCHSQCHVHRNKCHPLQVRVEPIDRPIAWPHPVQPLTSGRSHRRRGSCRLQRARR